jgi:hypothetical protein
MTEEPQQSSAVSRHPGSTERKPIRCDADNCGHPALSTVELHFFCVAHFISYCYDRLEQCRPPRFADADEDSGASNGRFLEQCADQAATLLRPFRGLDNLDRARLFDIMLWASELATAQTAPTEKLPRKK